jgi:hypothetical protein
MSASRLRAKAAPSLNSFRNNGPRGLLKQGRDALAAARDSVEASYQGSRSRRVSARSDLESGERICDYARSIISRGDVLLRLTFPAAENNGKFNSRVGSGQQFIRLTNEDRIMWVC